MNSIRNDSKIVFRVDSGNHIGAGHLIRCLTLAEELCKMSSCEIHFITRSHLGARLDLIPTKYSIHLLNPGVTKNLSVLERADYNQWLGVTESEDAFQTNKIINKIGLVSLMIIDHYSLGYAYESSVNAARLMIIDDLMTRNHLCNFLLDQNLSADESTYRKLVPKSAKLFLGPEFGLLKSSFKNLRLKRILQLKETKYSPNPILVFFGLSDVSNDTLKFLNCLEERHLSNFKFTIILPSSHSTFNEVQKIVSLHLNLTLFEFSEDMAKTMSEHSFFIGAGGATSWERVVLGIPSGIVASAKNQIPICLSLQEKEFAFFLGESNQVAGDDWRRLLDNLESKKSLLQEMSQKCIEYFQGDGTKIVAKELVS